MLCLADVFPELKANLKKYKIHLAIGGVVKREPLIALTKNGFKEWQEYQNNKNFERDYILSLVYYRANEWLYAGIYKKIDVMKNYNEIRKKEYYRYTTELMDTHTDLIGRAIFKFQKEFRQSYVLLENHYRNIYLNEILGKPYRIGEFQGYENVLLTFEELKEIAIDEEISWKTALSNIKGIYLITDIKNGKQYIGAAYGDDAFWSRWQSYANNGHGNNNELKRIIDKNGLDYANNFQFSILEIRSKITDDAEIQRRESHWKNMLRTREHGYNEN